MIIRPGVSSAGVDSVVPYNPINIGVIGNTVNSHCGGEQKTISDGGPGCTY